MSNWVEIGNFDGLMCDYQKSSSNSAMMPGLGTYLKQITTQNEQIIDLLKSILDKMK